jgi:hypothetical protein
MANILKKENITIVIREYNDGQGNQKKVYKTIGELVTWQGDDGSTYQSGEMWGPTGSTQFKVFEQNNNQQQPQQGAPQQHQQQAPQQYQQPQQGQQNNSGW